VNEIIKYQWQGQDIELTKQDVKNLISTNPNVTDKEIEIFRQLCKFQKLNPYVKEAYLIKYGAYPATIVVGKEVFTKRAENNPNFDGYEIKDNYKAGMKLSEFEVSCSVYRKNLTHPISVTVSYPEYVGTNSKGEVNKMWKSKPRTMLRKVALMQTLREAFPTALGGLYEEHEIDQQAIPKEVDITPKTEVKAEGVKDDFEKHNLKVVDKKRLEKVKVVEEAEVVKEELPTQADIDKIFPPSVALATDKQKDMLIKMKSSKFIKQSELDKMPKLEKTNIDEASKMIKWWFGNKEDGIVGERELRELKDKDKPKGKRDELIELIRDTAKIKQIPKDKLKKISGMKTFDTLMGCKIEVLEKVLEYCQKY